MIRPVEMQGVIQRSQDVSNIKQEEMLRPAVEQMNINIKYEKDIKHKSEQVVKKDNPARNETKYDAKEKGNNQYYHQETKKRKFFDTEEDESDGKVIIKHISRFDASV